MKTRHQINKLLIIVEVGWLVNANQLPFSLFLHMKMPLINSFIKMPPKKKCHQKYDGRIRFLETHGICSCFSFYILNVSIINIVW